jgi:Ca-activated chloride channel family protein
VDVSGSMAAPDVRPDRIKAAITGINGFLEVLPKDDQAGLMTFSDRVQIVAAPTTDRAAVTSGLDVLKPEGGTALGAGIDAAVKLLVSKLAAAGVYHRPGTFLPAAIVLESDGAQDRGTVTPYEAAQLAKAAGIRIYGIALGTRDGYIAQGSGFSRIRINVPPDRGTIALLARVTGGQAFYASNATSLDTIYRKLGRSVGHLHRTTEIAGWFDAVAAVLLILGVGLGRARTAALP